MTFLKFWIAQFKAFVLGTILVCVYLPYSWLFTVKTLRTRSFVTMRSRRRPAVFAHWHQDELLLVGYYAFRGLGVLSSQSRDGTLMAMVLRLLGFRVKRGSSTRGGAAGFMGLLHELEQAHDVALAVDGPRGPIFKVKPGVIELALKSGVDIVPCGIARGSAWVFQKAWNKCYMPKPFSRHVLYIGKPISVATHDGSSDPHDNRENLVKHLESELHHCRSVAERWVSIHHRSTDLLR